MIMSGCRVNMLVGSCGKSYDGNYGQQIDVEETNEIQEKSHKLCCDEAKW